MSIPIPEKVLNASEKILLRDLLESPSLRPWIISGLSNAVNCSYENGEALLSEDEEFLHFRLRQMLRSIDYKTRKESFDYTRQMIYKRKIDRANYLQRKANPCWSWLLPFLADQDRDGGTYRTTPVVPLRRCRTGCPYGTFRKQIRALNPLDRRITTTLC